MKKISRLLLIALVIATFLLSACGGAVATPNGGGNKVEPVPVAFVGPVESMAGDQWVINGNTVTVDPAVIRDGPFNVGDQVKVEGVVNSDGSFIVSRVEVPTPQDTSTLPQFGSDNSNDSNTNDANVNDANINDVNVNDDNSNSINSNDANTNDENGNDANVNDDNGSSANSNDNNGNNDNSNTDDSNDSNSNDDNSGSGGDDSGGDDNSGDGGNDHGGNSND